MQKLWTHFAKDESGATAIEYALIAAFIALALIAGAQAIGLDLIAVFTNVTNAL